jgi:hypothetical protein
MFLIYGLDPAGELVRIDQVAGGKTNLGCPYCGRALIARRGKILASHFAHAGQTCRPGDEYLSSTPVLLDFNLFRQSLTRPQARSLNELRRLGWVFRRPGTVTPAMMTRLETLGFIGSAVSEDALRQAVYWATPRSEAFFLRLHPAAWLDFAFDVTRNALAAAKDELTARLIRAELALWQSLSLYLLEITGLPELYKIGITARPITERVAEVRRDLTAAGHPDAVEVLRLKPGCGAVESYLKARWQPHRAHIGLHQEYFWLRGGQAAILADLDLIKLPEPRPTPEPGRQRWRALFAGVESLQNEWTGRWYSHLRFVAVRDRYGNAFADTVLFKAGKNFDDIDLTRGDLVEFTATPDDSGRLLRPAKIKVKQLSKGD